MAKTLNFKPLCFKMTLILSVVTGSSAKQVNFHGVNENTSSTSDVPQFTQRLISSQQHLNQTQQHQQSGQQEHFQQRLVRSLQDGQSEEQQKDVQQHEVHQERGRSEDKNESQQKQLDDGNESEERQLQDVTDEDEYQQDQEESEDEDEYQQGQEELEDDAESQQRQLKSENKDDLEEQEGEGDREDESQQGQKESENEDEYQQGQEESEDNHDLEKEERRREGDNEGEFEEQEGEQEELEEVVPLTGSQSEQDTDTASTVLRATFAETPIEINGIAINVTEVTSQIDKGHLPAANVLRAIFSTPLKPSEYSTPTIQELKEYLLDQIVSDKELVIRALLLKEVSMVREIVDRIYIGKRSDEFANPHDGSDVLNDILPASDVIATEQPIPSFFGKIRHSFRGGSKPEPKIGDLDDNDEIPDDSVEHHGVGSGRSSASTPVEGSSHLAPLAARASDLKRYNFKPNNAGLPKITKERIITRMRRDKPLRRTDMQNIIAKHEENMLKDNKQRSYKLHQQRDSYQRNTNRKDLVDPTLAVSGPRLKSKMVLNRRSCTTVRCLNLLSHQGSQDVGATMSI